MFYVFEIDDDRSPCGESFDSFKDGEKNVEQEEVASTSSGSHAAVNATRGTEFEVI